MEGMCFLCGNYETVERHHIFGGALRPKADKLGLTVMLCPWCHQYDADSAHRSAETRQLLRRYGQRKAMAEQGWDAARFIREFGKNYLEADELTEDGRLPETEWNRTGGPSRAPAPTGGPKTWENAGAFRLLEEAALPW